jgi:hypothetical protein
MEGAAHASHFPSKPMTDNELIDYLRDSSDPDDHSIVVREDILHWLNSKLDLTRTEAKWVGILEEIRKPELRFLHAPIAYRIRHPRPCMPMWHWPHELLWLKHQMYEMYEQRETWYAL